MHWRIKHKGLAVTTLAITSTLALAASSFDNTKGSPPANLQCFEDFFDLVLSDRLRHTWNFRKVLYYPYFNCYKNIRPLKQNRYYNSHVKSLLIINNGRANGDAQAPSGCNKENLIRAILLLNMSYLMLRILLSRVVVGLRVFQNLRKYFLHVRSIRASKKGSPVRWCCV